MEHFTASSSTSPDLLTSSIPTNQPTNQPTDEHHPAMPTEGVKLKWATLATICSKAGPKAPKV